MSLLYNFMGYAFMSEILTTTGFLFFYDLIEIQCNVASFSQRSLIVIFALLAVVFFALMVIIKMKKDISSANLKLSELTEAISEHNIKQEIADHTISVMKTIAIRHFEILKGVSFEQRISTHIIKNADEMHKKINHLIYDGNLFDWDIFYETANIVHDGYFEKVKHKFPQLDNLDFIICCMNCLKIRNNEIADLTGISTSTVSNRKTEIRKKLQMGDLQNIPKFIDRRLNE